MIADARLLKIWLGALKPRNAQGEYYLTDIVGVLHDAGYGVGSVEVADPVEVTGVNDRAQLARAEQELRHRINQAWMGRGVTMLDPDHTYLDCTVVLAPDVTIWSGRSSPDATTAPLLALASVPGMDLQHAAAAIATRSAATAGNPATGLVANNGITHSIRSEAVLADGTRAVLRATVRLQGFRPGSQAFAVLRWQEGDGE